MTEGADAVPARAAPPLASPPVPPLFGRRTLVAVIAGSVLAAAALVTGVVLLVAHGMAARVDTDSQVLRTLRTQVATASAQLQAESQSFESDLTSDVDNGDSGGVASVADVFAEDIATFDEQMSQLTFPPAALRNAGTMLDADHTLILDLADAASLSSSSGVQTWLQQVTGDYQVDSTAHTTVENDLGITPQDLAGAASGSL